MALKTVLSSSFAPLLIGADNFAQETCNVYSEDCLYQLFVSSIRVLLCNPPSVTYVVPGISTCDSRATSSCAAGIFWSII
jgi:hypothetical protein